MIAQKSDGISELISLQLGFAIILKIVDALYKQTELITHLLLTLQRGRVLSVARVTTTFANV